MRLIAAHGRTDGTYRAGISIAMRQGSHTYWKQPGDAGVPPVFDFGGSTNVRETKVLFPVPSRIKEEGLEAFGYTGTVVLPVIVTPADPAKPSVMHVDMTYAVCDRICIPAKASVDLGLPAEGAAADAAVAEALAAVPRDLPTAESGKLRLSRVAGATKPTWTVTWSGAEPMDDLFADAPEGYAFDTRSTTAPASWTLVASEVAIAPGATTVPVTLTLAGKDAAGKNQGFVTTRTLDLSAAAP